MFQFWYEKFVAAFIPILVFISIFLLIFYAFYTVIAVPPAEEAVFVQEIRKTAAEKESQNTISYANAHRSDGEIKTLLTKMVSESLSFGKDDFGGFLKTINPYFTDRGFQIYKNYLMSSDIVEIIRVNDYDMSVYIEQPPMSLNGMVVDNVYKWLYQMPVVVSFYPKGSDKFAENAGEFVNRKLNLRVQLTRGKVGDDIDAIQIEDWVVTGR